MASSRPTKGKFSGSGDRDGHHHGITKRLSLLWPKKSKEIKSDTKQEKHTTEKNVGDTESIIYIPQEMVGLVTENLAQLESKSDTQILFKSTSLPGGNAVELSINGPTQNCEKAKRMLKEMTKLGDNESLVYIRKAMVGLVTASLARLESQSGTEIFSITGLLPSADDVDVFCIAGSRENKENAKRLIKEMTSDKEWELEPDLVKIVASIGTGPFGEVYQGEYGPVGTVAIKTLSGNMLSRKSFFDMTTVWKILDHPCFVKLIGVCSYRPWYIISEYMEKGNLLNSLRGEEKPSVFDMVRMGLQICQGLKFLESRNLVHCGVNTQNILVSGEWNVKIYAAWLCKGITDEASADKSINRLSFSWDWPPEVISEGNISLKSSVWSFGALLSDIMTYGVSPYRGAYKQGQLSQMTKPEYIPQAFYDLMLACMDERPDKRPTFGEIEEKLMELKDSYVKGDEVIYNDAYRRALAQGEAIHTRIPIMLVGQDRSGKTSLKKHLMGLSFDADEPSTCGIEVDVVELTEANAEEPWEKKEMRGFILSEDEANEQVLKQVASLVSKQLSSENSRVEADGDPQPPQVDTILSTAGQMPVAFGTIPSERYVENAIHKESAPTLLSKPMMDNIRSLQRNVESVGSPPVRALVHDLAGQNVFYDTHYHFLKLQCPYVVVHDLRIPFENPAQPRFKPKLVNAERNLNNHLATNLDYFLTWLTVLSKLREAAGLESVAEFQAFKLPPVLIALTNSDRFEGDLDEIKNRIKEILTEKGFDNVFTEPYIIDNTSSRTAEDEVKKLRMKLFELCTQILCKQRPVPIRWLQFEASLSNKMLNENVPYISLEDAHQVGADCKVQDVDAAIKFLHHKGVLVHHSCSPVVVLNPVWLMNLFAEVITVPQEGTPSDAVYRKLVTKGILMQDYLRERVDGEILEDLMLRFGLICRWEHEDRPAFIVPSVAPLMESGQNVADQLSSSPIASLFFQFKRGYIPPGVFTRVLVKAIKTCAEFLRNRSRLFCNYTLLSFQRLGHKFDVYLIEELTAIKVGVVPRGTMGGRAYAKFALFLKQTMINCIQSIKEDEGLFYRNIDVVVCVKCTACSGEIGPCLRHGNRSCPSDDCGHFWTMEELQACAEDPICDFASVVETRVFPLKRVKPWTGLGDDQTPHDPTELTINDLDVLKRQKICRLLDVKHVCGSDFRDLAGHFGMCHLDLALISQRSDPTDEILTWASRNPSNTLAKLRQIFSVMQRMDCIEVMDLWIP